MRVGVFTECYRPIMNGVVVSIDSFKKTLEEKGHEVFVFAPEVEGATSEHGVYRFPSIADKKKRLYPILLPSINIEKTYLPEEIIKDLDIIHTQHMFTAGRLARYAASKWNKPLVYTYHTLIAGYTHYAGIFSPIVQMYLINMSKRFCNDTDLVITPSNAMKKILLSYGIKTPIEVVMTGIDPAAYGHVSESESKRLREKYKISENGKILLYLSRIAKEKNIDFLFKSFKKIQKEYPACHLLMVGGGPEEEWAHSRVKTLGIDKKVSFTGMVPKEEANKIFGMADIFTFPSYTETQGIVVAEAMASGTPPVAVGKMGPIDLIHDGEDGYLTKLSVSDFVDKTLKLLRDDELREKFGRAGLARVSEFSNETSTTKLISLYERILASKRSKNLETTEKAGTIK